LDLSIQFFNTDFFKGVVNTGIKLFKKLPNLTKELEKYSFFFLKRQSNPVTTCMYLIQWKNLCHVKCGCIWVQKELRSYHVLWHKCVCVILTRLCFVKYKL
jgi:hypothetical protein